MGVKAWPSLNGWMFCAFPSTLFVFVVLTLSECQKWEDNFLLWISRFVHRWRMQPAAISSVNCRTQWIIESWNANDAHSLPQIWQDYPLNLSILLSAGRETNKDFPSNGKWRGNSSNLKSQLFSKVNCSFKKYFPGELTLRKYCLEQHIIEGDYPVCGKVQSSVMCFPRVGLFGIAAKNGW